jgi:hypothetical protein
MLRERCSIIRLQALVALGTRYCIGHCIGHITSRNMLYLPSQVVRCKALVTVLWQLEARGALIQPSLVLVAPGKSAYDMSMSNLKQ